MRPFVRHVIYNHIENCPVWNFWKVYDTGDLRYLIKKKQIGILPEIYNKRKLQKAFFQILDSNSYQDFSILKLYYKCLHSYYQYSIDTKNSKKEMSYNLAFLKYIREYDKYYKEYTFQGENYQTLLAFYKFLHESLGSEVLMKIRMNIFEPDKINGKKITAWDIYKDIQYFKEILKIDINVKKITLKEYYVMLNSVKEKQAQYKDFEHGRKQNKF
ncbi:MAG: hypothetical protein GF317_23415 [Candidatus Lokiarchaeota archaeon]|nr:hypothetical protein [Candidatus Lokiarchaeota archaeon]